MYKTTRDERYTIYILKIYRAAYFKSHNTWLGKPFEFLLSHAWFIIKKNIYEVSGIELSICNCSLVTKKHGYEMHAKPKSIAISKWADQNAAVHTIYHQFSSGGVYFVSNYVVCLE